VALFLELYLGHVLGDFVLQPGRLVVAKRERQRAVLLHTAIVMTCTALVAASALSRIWPAILLTGVLHFGVEQFSIRARRGPKVPALVVFLLDQVLHVISLALIAILSGLSTTPSVALWPVSIGLLATICALSTVAFSGSIFVFEVEMYLRPPQTTADPILRLDGSRLYGMLERGGALAASLLLPSPVLGTLAFVPRLVYSAFAPSERKLHHRTAIGAGLLLCALAWALLVALDSAQ
jgi:hypothetical protein